MQVALLLDGLERQFPETVERLVIHVQQPYRLAYYLLAGITEKLGGGGVAIEDGRRLGGYDEQAVAQTGEGFVEQALRFPQRPLGRFSPENVQAQAAVQVFQLRRAAGNQFLQMFPLVPQSPFRGFAAANVERQNGIRHDQKQEEGRSRQRPEPVPPEERFRHVLDHSILRQRAWRNAEAPQLDIVEHIAVGTVGGEPHHRNRVRILAPQYPQGDLSRGHPLIESADQLSPQYAVAEIKVPCAINGNLGGAGNRRGALIVFEEPAGLVV